MSVLVFGAGGFIGTYLVDKLIEEGFDVLASDNDDIAGDYYTAKKIPFVHIDVTREESISELDLRDDIDAVVNVACLQPVNVSKSKYKASDYIRVNTIGMLNILEECRKIGVKKVIYTVSHRGVQGLWEAGETIDESSTKALKYNGDYSMFAISECAAQDCLMHYAAQYGLQEIILRLPPVYGYGPHLDGYVHGRMVKSGFMTFIEKATRGEPIELWGDADRARNVIYVKDVVSAIILSLRSTEAHGLYNIAAKEMVSLEQEAKEIYSVFSTSHVDPYLVYRPEIPNDIESFEYDISKAKKDLQWSPHFNFKVMLYDIKKEMESQRFGFLTEKRKKMFDEMD